MVKNFFARADARHVKMLPCRPDWILPRRAGTSGGKEET